MSCVFIDGEFTHAVKKTPIRGEFKVCTYLFLFLFDVRVLMLVFDPSALICRFGRQMSAVLTNRGRNLIRAQRIGGGREMR